MAIVAHINFKLLPCRQAPFQELEPKNAKSMIYTSLVIHQENSQLWSPIVYWIALGSTIQHPIATSTYISAGQHKLFS